MARSNHSISEQPGTQAEDPSTDLAHRALQGCLGLTLAAIFSIGVSVALAYAARSFIGI